MGFGDGSSCNVFMFWCIVALLLKRFVSRQERSFGMRTDALIVVAENIRPVAKEVTVVVELSPRFQERVDPPDLINALKALYDEYSERHSDKAVSVVFQDCGGIQVVYDQKVPSPTHLMHAFSVAQEFKASGANSTRDILH